MACEIQIGRVALSFRSVAVRIPSPKILYMGTGGLISGSHRTGEIVDSWLPATENPSPVTMIIDLGGVVFSPSALRELVVRVGQYAKGGRFGDARVVFAIPERDTAELVGLIAKQYQLPLYMAKSPEPIDVAQAIPTGDLTETERNTLEHMQRLGSTVTVSRLASQIGIEQTALNNRLSGLNGKGYIYRFPRSRRDGDLYLDPRVPIDRSFDELSALSNPVLREALLANDVAVDPYDHSPLVVNDADIDRFRSIVDRDRGPDSSNDDE